MKRGSYYNIICGLAAILLSTSCADLFKEDKLKSGLYDGEIVSVEVQIKGDESYEKYDEVDFTAFNVTFEDFNNGNKYRVAPDADGCAHAEIPKGVYRVLASGRFEENPTTLWYFNGVKDRLNVSEDIVDGDKLVVDLVRSKSGTLIIKEIYNGGCMRTPQEGDWQFDKYVILHNNSSVTLSLDGVGFGKVDPGNSTAANHWVDTGANGELIFRDYVPIADCVWEFPAGYSLEPGEQAVVVVNGAVDHSAIFPLSVKLDDPEYFVCYNLAFYPNPGLYHPAPETGSPERYLTALRKLGRATAYSLSVTCPGVVIYRIPDEVGTSLADYAADDINNILPIPGSSMDNVIMKMPYDWILDAVEVYSGSASNNKKRFSPQADGGYVELSQSKLGRTLYRNVDEDATLALPGNQEKVVWGYTLGADASGIDAEATIRNGGRVVYMDSNNSSVDFHERKTQSLHSSAPIHN